MMQIGKIAASKPHNTGLRPRLKANLPPIIAKARGTRTRSAAGEKISAN